MRIAMTAACLLATVARADVWLPPTPTTSEPYVDDEEYAVVAAAIDSRGVTEKPKPLSPWAFGWRAARGRNVDRAAVKDALRKPRARLNFALLDSKTPLRAATPGESTLAVSRVGFNSDRTHAILLLDFVCADPVCGSGSLVVLEKRAGMWTVVRTLSTWNG